MKRTALVLALLAATLAAQAVPGTPRWSAYRQIGPLVVDLANLNVHIALPVYSKVGRGVPFHYTLSYDSLIWSPGAAWIPASTWGWPGQNNVIGGQAGYSHHTATCYSDLGQRIYYTAFDGFYYSDPDKTNHGFPMQQLGYDESGQCPVNSTDTEIAADDSGYTMGADVVSSTEVDTSVWTDNGDGMNGLNGYIQDRNGNFISGNGTSVTDTLGATALSVSGSASAPPMVYTYAGPNGNETVTVNYQTYTVQTAFGCSGVSEYGPYSISLVSSIVYPDNTSYQFAYEPTPGHAGAVTGRIASITLPTGGVLGFTYTGANSGENCQDGTVNGMNISTPDTGSGAWQFTRSQIAYQEWATTVTAPSGDVAKYTFDGLFVTEEDDNSGASTLLRTVYTCYNGAAVPCNGYTAIGAPSQRTIITKLPNGLENQIREIYNAYGLVTESDEYDFGTNTPGALTRKTLTSYAALGNYINDLPSQITVEGGAGTVAAQTTFSYDQSGLQTTSVPNHAAVTGARGNLTTVSYLVAGSTTLTRTISYYDTGQVYQTVDPNGAATSDAFTCSGAVATAIYEPLNLSRQAQWNCTGAALTGSTDENGQTASLAYTSDPFWRPASATDAAGNTTTFTFGPNSAESALVFNNGGSTVGTLTTFEGLGRPHVVQRRQGPGSANFDSVETDYDSNGRAYRVSQPYQGTAGQLAPTGTAFTTTTFDGLGRTTQITDGGGGWASYTYSGNDVLISVGPQVNGENLKRRQLEFNGLGQLTSVCELTAASGSGTCGQTTSQTGYWTKYSYNTLGEIVGVSENAQSGSPQTRSFAFDGLGRLTSETNPESGTTAYTFDSDATCGTSKGDLVKRVDAMGNVTCYAHDALHRVTAITYPSGPYASATPAKTFVFDAATVDGQAMANAKGRLAEAFTGPASGKITDEGFGYDAIGRPSDLWELTPSSSGWYHIPVTYWANGVIASIAATGTPYFTYNLDSEGRVYSTGAANPLASVDYNAAGQAVTMKFASGDSDSYQYDASSGRMTEYQTTAGGQADTGALSWNANGTLASLAITDNITGSKDTQNCTYAHDDLGRLSAINCGSLWGQNFSFDPFGNVAQSGSMNWLASYAAATNQANLASYDGDGNVLSDGQHTYGWDAEGKLVSADGTAVVFDALGRMVAFHNGASIEYLPSGSKLAVMSGQSGEGVYFPLPGGAHAFYLGGSWYEAHADWLASGRLTTTSGGALYHSLSYAPYGQYYADTNPGGPSIWFTGIDTDTLTNVFDFPAREYSTIQGRWLSPDPAGLAAVDPLNPQSWNRYSYVYNQPLIYRDSDGKLPEVIVGAIIGAVFNGVEQGIVHHSIKAGVIGAGCGAVGGAIAGAGFGLSYGFGAAAATACDQKFIDHLTLRQMAHGRAPAQDAAAFVLGAAGGAGVDWIAAQGVSTALAGVTVAEAAFPLDIAADIFLGSETVSSTHTAVWPMINGKLGTGMISLTVTELDPASQLVSGFDPSAGASSGWLLGGGFNDYIGAQSLFGGGGAWGGVNWYPGMPVTFCFGSLCTDWGSISAHPGPAGQ